MAVEDWQERFIEGVVTSADIGLAPSLVRVLAWLIVCEPPHQSAEDLAATLGLSAGAVSSATSILVRGGLVSRRRFPADRKFHYELHPDGWQRLLQSRLQVLAEVRQVAEAALAGSPAPGPRLAAMRDFYAGCEAALAPLLGGNGGRAGKPAGRKKPAKGKR
ncbi:MAG TPA: helix-turn-helix domain-containing protein [Actinomycetota bacterium]|nr:helix-turn-helix domain-containing protein [Actinomycetota bacterium]